jgi:hypothetical protein
MNVIDAIVLICPILIGVVSAIVAARIGERHIKALPEVVPENWTGS